MLVSATEMLKKAKAGHYAVGQFNINNLEWTKSILLTAKECKSPVILGVSEGAGKYMGGYHAVVGMVNGLLKDLDIDGKNIRVIAKVFSPFKYDNDTRCDLHPRWSRDGKKICFDGTFEGSRGLYIVNLDNNE